MIDLREHDSRDHGLISPIDFRPADPLTVIMVRVALEKRRDDEFFLDSDKRMRGET